MCMHHLPWPWIMNKIMHVGLEAAVVPSDTAKAETLGYFVVLVENQVF